MNQTAIPNTSTHDVASFDILVNGTQQLNPVYEVLSLTLTQVVNKLPIAKIVLRDGSAADQDFPVSNADALAPGTQLSIKIGRDGNNALLFKGIVIHQGIKFRQDGNPVLTVECRDEAVKMAIGRHSKYYEQVKDSEVIEQLIRNHGLSSDVEVTSLQHKEMVQHHCSDWDFLLLRAEVNGKLVIVNQGKVQVKSPDTAATAALQLQYGSSLLELEAEMDARYQWNAVQATAWNYTSQQLYQAETSSVPYTEQGNLSSSTLAGVIGLSKYELQHSGRRSEEELQEWVKAAMLKSRLAKIRGRARFLGFPGILPGNVVTLQGMGNRYNGNAFVTGVRHEIANGSWDTHLQFGLEPDWISATCENIADVPAAGLQSGVHGLQIGVVVQLQDDPDGEHRIRVKIPVISNDARGIWVRMASLDAGNNRGAFFRPEIGDEVIVGFINEDPRDAIVLGMLNSSAKPAPITAQDANDEKGFVTRSGMRIHFNDNTKTIIIDTPQGNSITIDEASASIKLKDQNDNKITMDSSGIKVESPMDIELKAGANLKLSAAASLSIGGASISASADGMMELKGSLAKLSAQGITEITGSLVKIN